MLPDLENVKQKIKELEVNVSDRTMKINTSMININDKLVNFHVGRAMHEFVLTGIICFVIGICTTLFITQKCYGGLLKLSYTKEIELAEQRGMSNYRKNLYNSNSGLITIKELEREYVKNHKDTFNEPNEYIDSLTQQINQMKNSNWYKDE